MIKGKKILIITSEFPPNVGGIGNHAYNLAKALAGEGYSVQVITDIIDVPEEELNAFKRAESFDIQFIPRQTNVFKSYVARVRNALKYSKKVDIIICSNKFPIWLGSLLKAVRNGKQLIAVVHGSELDLKSALPKRMTAFSLKRFDKIISVSNYTQAHLPKDLPAGVRKYIIHNGINTAEYRETSNAELKGQPSLCDCW